MESKFEDCLIGRKMEVSMAKLTSDVEYIRKEQEDVKTDVKTILRKIDGFDDRYAPKSIVKVMGTIGVLLFTTLISIIAFLLKEIFFH